MPTRKNHNASSKIFDRSVAVSRRVAANADLLKSFRVRPVRLRPPPIVVAKALVLRVLPKDRIRPRNLEVSVTEAFLYAFARTVADVVLLTKFSATLPESDSFRQFLSQATDSSTAKVRLGHVASAPRDSTFHFLHV